MKTLSPGPRINGERRAFTSEPRNGPSSPASEPLPHQTTHRPFSLARAVGLPARGKRLDGLEGEVSVEIERRGIQPPQGAKGTGFFLPLDYQVRALTSTTGSGAVVSPGMEVIDILRARLVCARLGCRVLENLQGSPFYPLRDAHAAATWVSESTAPPDSNQTITKQAKFYPHTVSVVSHVSRWAQDLLIPSVEQSFLEDSASSIAVAVDSVALVGGGTDQPTGLLRNSSLPVVSFGANGGAPSNALLASMLQVLSNANGNDGVSLGFVTTPNAESTLRTTFRNGPGSKALLDERNFVLGCTFESTTNLPSDGVKGTGTGLSAAILGSWSSLALGFWPQYVVVNPYTQSSAGYTTMTFLQSVDVQVLQNSFVIALDVLTTP